MESYSQDPGSLTRAVEKVVGRSVITSSDVRSLERVSRDTRGDLSVHIPWNVNYVSMMRRFPQRETREPSNVEFLNMVAARALLYPSSDFSLSLDGSSSLLPAYVFQCIPSQEYLHVTLEEGQDWNTPLLSRVPFKILGLDLIDETRSGPELGPFEVFIRSLERGGRKIRELASRGEVSYLDPELFPDLTTIHFLLPNWKNLLYPTSFPVLRLFDAPILSVTTVLGAQLYSQYHRRDETLAENTNRLRRDLWSLSDLYPNIRTGDLTIILYSYQDEGPVPDQTIQRAIEQLQAFKSTHPSLAISLEVWNGNGSYVLDRVVLIE